MLKFSYFFYNIINFFIFINFIISFILILILVLTLLQKNFFNVYCLTAFTTIFLILFLKLLFQNFIINKIFYVFPETNYTIYTFDILLTFIFLQGFHYSIRYNFLYMFNLFFYSKFLNIK